MIYAQQYGVPTRQARPFNNYGPGLKITDKRVIPDFAREIFAGRDLVMFSDGKPTRTFCYSGDSIVGYYKVLVNGRDGEPYNIGTEKPEISMSELASGSPRPPTTCSATTVSRAPARARGGVPGRQPKSALSEHRQGRSSSATTRASRSRRACAAR